jgi:hypothetical protein
LWRCTATVESETSTSNSNKIVRAANSEWVWKENEDGSYGWHEMEIPDNIFDAYDGKATLHVSMPSGYKRKDLWITDKQGINSEADDYDSTYPQYKVGSLLIATKDNEYYTVSDWVEKTRYTDDTLAE